MGKRKSAPKVTLPRDLRAAYKLGKQFRKDLGIEGPITAGHVERLEENLRDNFTIRTTKRQPSAMTLYVAERSDGRKQLLFGPTQDSPDSRLWRLASVLVVPYEMCIPLAEEDWRCYASRLKDAQYLTAWFAAGFQGLSRGIAKDLQLAREPIKA